MNCYVQLLQGLMFFKLINRCWVQHKLTANICTSTLQFSQIQMADIAKGVQLNKVLDVLEVFAPKKLSESWDNTGLLVEPYTPRLITKILLTNDLTEDVVLEAKTIGCELVISYHPPIFAPLKSVTQSSWKEKLVAILLESRIALYSPHTSWDSVQGGVNDWLASCFPVEHSEPITQGLTPDVGCGRLLKLRSGLSLGDAITKVKTLTSLSHVRLALGRGRTECSEMRSVALCAGSGASVLKGVTADLYLTGEMFHHDVLDAAQKGTSVILTNHSDSERGFLTTFSPKLSKLLDGQVDIIVSKCDKDPLTTV